MRELFKENLPEIVVTPLEGTYLVWLDCRELGMNNEELRKFMIEEAKLGLNEGYTFGRSLSGFMRLNAACSRSILVKAMERLEAAVNRL